MVTQHGRRTPCASGGPPATIHIQAKVLVFFSSGGLPRYNFPFVIHESPISTSTGCTAKPYNVGPSKSEDNASFESWNQIRSWLCLLFEYTPWFVVATNYLVVIGRT
jgi:hypothetical protein